MVGPSVLEAQVQPENDAEGPLFAGASARHWLMPPAGSALAGTGPTPLPRLLMAGGREASGNHYSDLICGRFPEDSMAGWRSAPAPA